MRSRPFTGAEFHPFRRAAVSTGIAITPQNISVLRSLARKVVKHERQ